MMIIVLFSLYNKLKSSIVIFSFFDRYSWIYDNSKAIKLNFNIDHQSYKKVL